MSYDLSDRIDDYSRDMHGHSNWAYVDTLSKEDKAKIKGPTEGVDFHRFIHDIRPIFESHHTK